MIELLNDSICNKNMLLPSEWIEYENRKAPFSVKAITWKSLLYVYKLLIYVEQASSETE